MKFFLREPGRGGNKKKERWFTDMRDGTCIIWFAHCCSVFPIPRAFSFCLDVVFFFFFF